MFKGVKKVGPKHNLLKKVQAKQTGPKNTEKLSGEKLFKLYKRWNLII